MSAKNILLTGEPGVGKTTLIKEVLRELPRFSLEAGGFLTEEIREGGERKGFKIVSLEGKEGMLAYKGWESQFKVGSYGVNLKDLEEIGVEAVLKAIKEKDLVVIDEIGKMELFSGFFKKAVLMALESEKKVLATVKLSPDLFTAKIKNYFDTVVLKLEFHRREEIKKEVISLLLKGLIAK